MAQTVVGSWSLIEDSHVDHWRWTGPGSLGATWITPSIDINGPVHAFLYVTGSGTATNGGSPTFDAWGLTPDLSSQAGADADIRPRLAISFVGTGFQGSAHTDPATTLDGSSQYTNGSFLSMTGTSSSGTPPVICVPKLFFMYTHGTTTGGSLDYLDLYVWSAIGSR